MQTSSAPAAGEPASKDVIVEIDKLTKSYGTGKTSAKAIDSVTFSVNAGEFVSVVGPSGCGKTTLMMSVAGLLPISGGSIRFRQQVIKGPAEGVAVVFQDYSRSLFPWLTCARNVALGLQGHGLSRAETRKRAQESLEMVDLPDVGHLYPWQLSGGMQQRVAIARSLALSPTLLIMDEPFASVDAQTRASLEDLLLDVWTNLGMTVLFVTHDIDEAVYLSDRVVVLSQRPSVVRKVLPVNLPRARDQIVTKDMPEFAHLRAAVYSMVMGSQRRSEKTKQQKS